MRNAEDPQNSLYTTLHISQEKLRAILNSVVDGIITINKNGVIEATNPSAETMFGYSKGELIGQNVSVLMPAPFADEHDRYISNYLRTGEAKIIGIGRELSAKRKDGSIFPIELSVSEVDHLSIFTGIIRDITERKIQQEKLLESERLAGLGQATAGLVHESRNSLARIQANLRMMKRRIPKDARLFQFMSNAIDASEDLARQFEEVREFSSSVKPKLVLSDLRNLLNQAWGQLKIEETSKSTSFVVSSGTEHTLAEVDEFMITNAFRNILQNAMDSMESGGTITVSFFETHETQRKSICLVFMDDGAGISEEGASLAFDAFYTTKTRGTGLGLAIVKRYIEAHGGTVNISPSETGTSVTVTLPLNSEHQE